MPLAGEAMTSTRARVIVLCSLVLAVGCGYVSSGRWDDEPENWKRAFGWTQPSHVVVVHSHYWRSPHWSYEAGYLFEIQPNDAFHTQLVREKGLRPVQSSEVLENARPCFGECPAWFVPKALESYEIWADTENRGSNFRMFIDKESRAVFFGDYLV